MDSITLRIQRRAKELERQNAALRIALKTALERVQHLEKLAGLASEVIAQTEAFIAQVAEDEA
jgi:uncharacterized protein YaaN involved in tellurite resistance